MKSLLQKVNSLSLLTTLFLIFVFYLPFQKVYEKPLKMAIRFFAQDNYKAIFHSNAFHLYFSDLLIIAMGGICLLKGRFIFKKSGQLLIGFLIICLISILTSPHRAFFWVYDAWLLLLIPSFLYFILESQLDIKEALMKGLWIFFFASLFEGAIAIAQFIKQAPLGLKALGEPSFFPHICSSKASWLFDSGVIFRASGTLNHSNVLGCFMAVGILISFYLYLSLDKPWKKYLFFVALLIQELALFISFSRTALYGFIGCSLLLLSLFYWKKIKIKSLLIHFLAGLFICGFLLYPELKDRGGIFNYNAFAKQSDLSRLFYQKNDIQVAMQHPYCGKGLHHCFFNMDFSKDVGTTFQVHNIYIMLAAAVGWGGLALFLAFIGSILFDAFKGGLDPLSSTLLATFLFLLWDGCTDYLIIKSACGRFLFFSIAGLLSAYSNRYVCRAPLSSASYR